MGLPPPSADNVRMCYALSLLCITVPTDCLPRYSQRGVMSNLVYLLPGASHAGNQKEVQAELSRAGRTFAKYRPTGRPAGRSASGASFSSGGGSAGTAQSGSATMPLALQVSGCCCTQAPENTSSYCCRIKRE